MSEVQVDRIRLDYRCSGCGNKNKRTIVIEKEDAEVVLNEYDDPDKQLYALCGGESLISDPTFLNLIYLLLGSVSQAVISRKVNDILDEVKEDGVECECGSTNGVTVEGDINTQGGDVYFGPEDD